MGASLQCKAVFGRQKRAQKWRFSRIRGLKVKFLFSNPEKAHPCAEPRRLTYFA